MEKLKEQKNCEVLKFVCPQHHSQIVVSVIKPQNNSTLLQVLLECHCQSYFCLHPLCDQSFKTPKELRNHFRKHVGKNSNCEICAETKVNLSHYVGHLTTQENYNEFNKFSEYENPVFESTIATKLDEG
jgi:REP element-mobilizing transposase RayT